MDNVHVSSLGEKVSCFGLCDGDIILRRSFLLPLSLFESKVRLNEVYMAAKLKGGKKSQAVLLSI